MKYFLCILLFLTLPAAAQQQPPSPAAVASDRIASQIGLMVIQNTNLAVEKEFLQRALDAVRKELADLKAKQADAPN